MYYIKRFLLLFVMCLGTFIFSNARQVINFNLNTADRYLGKMVSTYSDTGNHYSFERIRKSDNLFRPGSKDVVDFGITPFNHWVKFEVTNKTDDPGIVLNIAYPPIDAIDFYFVKDDSVMVTHVSETTKISDRPYNHQFFLFDIRLAKNESGTCYLKLRSTKQLIVPVSLSTPRSIIQELQLNDSFSGLYLGIMMVMILYNLFIYFSAKDKQYLLYVNYIFWVAVAQATLLGYPQRFLFESAIWLNKNLLGLAGAMSGVATVMFVKDFLNTKTFSPFFHTALNVILLIDAVAIILLFAGFPLISYQVFNITAAIGAITIFATACVVYKANHKPAFYFLVAWSIFLFSVLIFVLKDFGVVEYNFFTLHSVQLGSALEAVLLSFALANKINTLKREKDQSRLAALRIAKENSRIIKEQNVVLEIKVKKRTEELEHKNDVLNQTLHDLQQTQLQLVESEKMASLGQLTAGIAHEINNPINFVTGNIGPLKRDVDILFSGINMLEQLNSKGISDDEKIKTFAGFKQEQDFDYLKIEINHLLKGINEGASRTAEIVKSLRIFSRLDEDDLKLADINEGLESTLIIVNNLLSNVSVIKEYGALPLVTCYPGKLNQVFLNIISNALFAITERHGDNNSGTLKVRTALSDQSVLITIADNGTGMSEATKRKMFDPFFTTKDVGQGTGLGMSIAFNTIVKHKGNITVDTTEGLGTTFTLEIPLEIYEEP